MPSPATLRERRLRKTKAQLIDEIDTLERRAAASPSGRPRAVLLNIESPRSSLKN